MVTFHRTVNLLKLLAGYFISRLTRRVSHWGMPAALSVEPTNHCNLRCPECPGGMHTLTRERGNMDPGSFKKIIDQVYRHIFYLNLYFQGEPFLNPGFFDMVKYALSKGIFVNTSTNGHFLDPVNARMIIESGLNRIIISLDGTDQRSYSSYRIGGSFEKVTEGIKNLVAARKELGSKTPRIVIQFLVLRSNEHQVPEIKEIVKELGADRLELKSAQFYDFRNGNPMMPLSRKYSRYGQQGNVHVQPTANCQLQTATFQQYKIKNAMPNHCFRMWSSCVITWDGLVAPCCFDKDVTFPMGDLGDRSFYEVWNGPVIRNFRQRILSERKSIDICMNCTEGMGISYVF